MSTKVSSLTQATNVELADASLAYVVTDPGGTPASKKSTLARIGARPKSWLDRVFEVCGATESLAAANATTGVNWIAARSGQTCTGVRFFWPSEGTARTIKVSLWETGSGTALKTANVTTTSGSAGYYTGTFASAQSLDTTKIYQVSVYETSGSVCYVGVLPATAPGGQVLLQPITRPIEMRDYTVVSGAFYNSSGDSRPNTNTLIADRIYSVEPLVSG